MIVRATLTLCLFTACVVAQAPTVPNESNVPELLSASQDTVSPHIREARSKMFQGSARRLPNTPTILDPPQPGQPPTVGPFALPRHDMPEFPMVESDLVILGEVIRSQPFVTYNMRGLNTENAVRIVTMIKPALPGKPEIAVVELGGKAWYNGRIIEWNVRGLGDALEPGRQYLLFLRYQPEADAYFMYKFWHADNNVLKAAYPGDKQNDGRIVSDVVASLKGPSGLPALR